MNESILCIYYSRTGVTERVAQEIAISLGCECVEIYDHVDRDGALGWLRCGLDAVKKRTRPICEPELEHPLSSYRLVIVCTPVWAGRCSSVVRSFLQRRGGEVRNVAYVITHRSERPYREVYEQMDRCAGKTRVAEVSLRPGKTGYDFWRDQFLKRVADFVS